MKFLPAQLAFFLQNRAARRNVRLLGWHILALVVLITAYSVTFHFLMAYEGKNYSWLTGLYWTLTVMSTLGFGDITFSSDLGRVFSIMVLVSGVLFLLVVLPFAFIQFFLAPWIEAQSMARARRELPADIRGHVLLTNYDSITATLAERLKRHRTPYAVIVQDLKRALELHDQGVKVVVGDLDDPETYRRCRLKHAAMVAATGNDRVDTTITFTVRELSPEVPIVANAETSDAVDILQLAGATHVFQLKSMLGRFLARRTIGLSSRANVVGRFGELVIAEASATRSPLVGRTIAEAKLRETIGVTVVGLWERGKFELARPDSRIGSATVLILAGTEAQLAAYDELFLIYVTTEAPVMILGGGRVGLAVAKALEEREMDYRIVESDPALILSPKHVLGNAADRETLEKAGLGKSLTAIITTSDDDTNVYLTVFCRRLSPDMQIISRANFEKNVSTLHRAGADFVMSYASMGANTILNVLEGEQVLMFAEGLTVFRIGVPRALVGRRLRDTRIREQTGCNVLAVESEGETVINAPPDTVLHAGDHMLLIGSAEGEERLLRTYPDAPDIQPVPPHSARPEQNPN